MRQFEIFCFHTRNFIKKKQLFLFSFFSLGRAQIQLKELMSQEKTWQTEGTFCQDQERGRKCAEWPHEQQKDCCLQEDHSLMEILPSLFFHSYCETQSMSSVVQTTDVASEPALQGLVLMTLSASQFGQGLTSSTSVAANSMEHCLFAMGLTSLYFPNQRLAVNLHFYRHFS